MSGPVGSAFISEIISRTATFVTGKYNNHESIDKSIHHLEMLRIKIKSAVEISEAFDINIESLLEWQEKLKTAVAEAEETLGNFNDRILRENPNRTVEGGSSSHDQSMQEEGSDDTTFARPASNLRETVTRQVNLEANLPHDQFMQEEASDDATLVLPASNLCEAITCQVDLEPNLPHVQSMQEEGSDDATLVHPASNLRKTVTRQVDLEANLPHDPFMPEEGSDGATLVQPASNLRATITRQVDQEANLPHDQQMQEEGPDDDYDDDNDDFYDILIRFARVITGHIYRKVKSDSRMGFLFEISVMSLLVQFPLNIFRELNYQKLMLGEYLENDKKVSKLKDTVEKLEKMAGDIGEFIELLKLQSKRNMSRKRKRTGVALQGFFLVLSLKLQTYALFCYGEDPYLLVIKLYRANCNIPTGITSEIFIGFIM